MKPTRMPMRDDGQAVRALRALAGALSRTAGTPLIGKNHVRLLKDARENYPAWLEAINAASRLDDLTIPPSNRLEKLKGDLKDFHSIRINDQWRVIFKWINGEPYEVRIVDYH